MQWYYVVAIVVAILVGAAGIITSIIKGIWMLSGMFGKLETSISELRLTLAHSNFKLDEAQKDVAIVTTKVENIQLSQNSLQARTIRLEENSVRLEEKVDKLGH